MAKQNYGAESIEVLSQIEAVRKKAGMYVGNTNHAGLHHLFYEILSNSIDEIINGYGDKIIVRLLDKETIEIEDFGRGIPFGMHPKLKKEVLEMNFTTLHSGGKIDNTKSGGSYKNSGGTNGVGVAITNFLSTYLSVTSIRENETATLEFENGISKKHTQITKKKSKRTGTIVRFSPDFSIFNGVKRFSSEYILGKIQDQVYLENITIIFEDNTTGQTYTFKNEEGITKFVSDYNLKGDEEFDNMGDEDETQTRIGRPIISILSGQNLEQTGDNGQKVSIDFAFEIINESKKNIKAYTNSIYNPDGGKHLLGFNNGIYKGIQSILKYQGQEGERLIKEMLPEDVLNNVIGIVSVKLPDPQFQSQTKDRLTNTYVASLVEEEVSKIVEKDMSQQDIKKLTDFISKRIDHRKDIAKKELKLAVATSEKDLQKKLPTKLTDATNNDRSKTELFIVEGDSAAGGLKKERDPQIHSIMPLRGKLLNALDSAEEKAAKNQEINNLIYAISAGRLNKEFNIKKHLRYGKIIILADADVDGLHISSLVIAFFVKYYFELIQEGYLYIANAPLFSASKKDDVKYFYSIKEKDKFLATKEGQSGYKIGRFKGLGEMNDDELANTALNTKLRSLHKVTLEDAEESKRVVTELMSSAKARFELVKNYQEVFLEKVANDEIGLEETEKELISVVKDNNIMYAMEVNENRMIPYLEDGLKNVNRRTLFALAHDFKSKSNGNLIKSATVTGNVIGYYHPHGDTSVYEAMVYMIQDFRQNHQLVEGHGSFGSIFSPDGYGAMRYTEVRMGKFAEDFLVADLAKKPVPFQPNFLDTSEEPVVMPAKIPLALVFGNNGIGYGMSHDSLQHNLREVIDATLGYLKTPKNKPYHATDYIKGPDLPQGGYIINTAEEIKEIYNNPRGGKFTFRVTIEPFTYQNKQGLMITNVPANRYNTESLMSRLKELLLDGSLYGIKQIIDISGSEKIGKKTQKSFRLFFELINKKEIQTDMVIENLYKVAKLEYSLRYAPLYINKNKEIKYYTLNDIISEFVDFRREIQTNILEYDIAQLEKDLKINENRILFAMNIEKIVKIIKNNNTRNQIKKKIIEAFPKAKLTDNDAEIIIETKLISIKDLSSLEKTKKEKERALKKLHDILSSPKKLDKMIIEDLEELRKKYNGAVRKTKFLLLKDLKFLNSMKEQYKDLQKQIKEESLIKPNYIYIDELGFLFRDFAVNESTVENRLEKFKETKGKDKPFLSIVNNNIGTLYVLSDKNSGYYIHLNKLDLKIDRSAINRLIKGFKGEVVGAFLYDKETARKDTYTIIYQDEKGNIGGFRIKTDDIAKTRQGFVLFKNKNKIVKVFPDGESIDLTHIKKIDFDKYKNVRKTSFEPSDFPIKKSFSSGKTVLKIKKTS